MTRLFYATTLLAFVGLCTTALAAKPSDVNKISRLSKVYSQGVQDPSKAWVEKAVEAGLKHRSERLQSLAKQDGYEALLLLEANDLEEKLAGPVRRLAKKVRDSGSVRKRLALVQEMLILSTEDSALEEALAKHLRFPGIGELLEVKLEAAKVDFAKYVSVSSETERLELIKSKTKLGAERGGTGAKNGIPDAGEWLKVSMAVKNVSDMPYFSSSAWVTTSSECAWAPPAQEFEFPELPPGGDGAGELNIWVYLSRSCPDGETVTLRVNVKDTHRTRGEGHVLSVRIPVQNRLRHRVGSLRFDRDVPGFSDGSEAKITDGGQSFELSHDMHYTTSGFKKAYMGWAIDGDGSSLVQDRYFRADAPMIRGGGEKPRLLPGDDLDIQTISRKRYAQQIKELARSKKWVTRTDAHMIFATDVLLAYFDPQPPPKPKERVTVESNCSDGKDEDGDGATDCADSDCKGKAVCKKAPKPANVSDVMSLVRATTRIEAQRTEKKGGDAIDAVNDHYELSFDSDTFARNYQCLVDEVPLEKCGEKECPSCKKKPKQKPKKVAPAPGPRYVQYVKRTYFRVPVNWSPPDPCDTVTCNRPAAPRCSGSTLITERSPGTCSGGDCSYKQRRVDCADSNKLCRNGRCVAKPKAKKPEPPPEPPKPREPLPERGARLDVAFHNAGIEVPTVDIAGKELWDTNEAGVSEFNVRYSHGFPGLTYFGALAMGSTEIDSLGDVTKLSTFSLSAGAGYLLALGERLELHPRAGLALAYRGLEIDETPWTDDGTLLDANMDVGAMKFGFELGAGLRARVTASLAAHLDFAFMMMGASPAWTTPDGEELTLLSGSHSRFGGGLTWMW